MKDMPFTNTYDSTNPNEFREIPIIDSPIPIQNGFYCFPQELILSTGMYAPLGKLIDSNGNPISQDGQLERLLSAIRAGTRVQIPQILTSNGEDIDFLSSRVVNIVVNPEFPKNGRELEYQIGFLE